MKLTLGDIENKGVDYAAASFKEKGILNKKWKQSTRRRNEKSWKCVGEHVCMLARGPVC